MEKVLEELQEDERVMEIIVNNGETQVMGLNLVDLDMIIGSELSKDNKSVWNIVEPISRKEAFLQSKN